MPGGIPIKLLRIKRIRVRIALYLSVFVVLVIVLVSLSISLVYNQELIAKTGTIAQQNIRIVAQELDEELNDIFGLCDGIRDQENLQVLMAAGDLQPSARDGRMREIAAILRQSVYSRPTVSSIFACGLAKEVYDPLYQISPYREIFADYQPFDDFISSGRFSALSAPTSFPNVLSGEQRQEKTNITYFSQYLSNNNFHLLGYILVNVNRDYLFRDIRRTCQQMFDFTYLIDEQGRIIDKTGQTGFADRNILDLKLQRQSSSKLHRLAGEDYYLVSQPLTAYGDWTLVGGMSYSNMQADTYLVLKIVYLIGLFSILIAATIAYLLSRKVTDPILAINGAMAQFADRKWPEPLTAGTEDELKSLVTGFNQMVAQFRDLLDQVRLEHEEKERAEVKSLQLKLDLLQAQINPHFVHNTLNAVQYLALKQGAEDIREIVQSFNLLLRASMSLGRDFITIREELSCVDSYMKIMGYRYDNEVHLDCQAEEGLLGELIPKLILQPLVENAFYHGLLPKGGGTIQIRVTGEEGRILVQVSDDGVGMDPAALARIFADRDQPHPAGYSGIGLKNIQERLRLYYGDSCQLHISSEPGTGTRVWFRIPRASHDQEVQ